MKIEKINKNNHFELVLSNNETLIIDEDVYTDYFLYVGKELDNNILNEIKEKQSLNKYKQYCFNILNKKSYSKKTIIEKLKNKGLTDQNIDKIVTYFISLNLINDDNYLEDLIISLENKTYGYYYILKKIKENDLNENYQYDENKEKEKIKKVLPNLIKKYNKYSFNKMKNSIYNSLSLMGYKDDIIKNTLLYLEKDEHENEKLKNEFIKITYKLDKNEIILKKDKIIKKLLMHGFNYSDIINEIDGELENDIN